MTHRYVVGGEIFTDNATAKHLVKCHW